MEFTDTDIEIDYELPSNDLIFDGSILKFLILVYRFSFFVKKLK
jgi:hypothetical protein